jgi:hypothetical protein
MFEDGLKAIQLNDQYFKAFLRSGEAAVELGRMAKEQNTDLLDQGIKYLTKALYLCWKVGPINPDTSAA